MNLKKIPASHKSHSGESACKSLGTNGMEKCKLMDDFKRNYILFSNKTWQKFYIQHSVFVRNRINC